MFVYNAGDLGLIPGLGKSPGERSGNPGLLPGKSHGQRSLVGYSPWGRKESDTTEQIHFTSLHFTLLSRSNIINKQNLSSDPEIYMKNKKYNGVY